MKDGKKARRPAPKRRNPLARELADPRYRKRVVKSPTAYKRRPKHPEPRGSEDGGGNEER